MVFPSSFAILHFIIKKGNRFDRKQADFIEERVSLCLEHHSMSKVSQYWGVTIAEIQVCQKSASAEGPRAPWQKLSVQQHGVYSLGSYWIFHQDAEHLYNPLWKTNLRPNTFNIFSIYFSVGNRDWQVWVGSYLFNIQILNFLDIDFVLWSLDYTAVLFLYFWGTFTPIGVLI